MKKILIICLSIICFCTFITASASSSAGKDAGGTPADFGPGRGSAQIGKLSGLAGVKISLYNTTTNTFSNYSFAIPSNSGDSRAKKINDAHGAWVTDLTGNRKWIDAYSIESFSLSKNWAGSSNGGLSFNSGRIAGELCGSATGNNCDATIAFYKIANQLISNNGLSCTMSEDDAGNLIFSNSSCQTTLSGYRIILEPIYALGTPSAYDFVTFKGIGFLGQDSGTTNAAKYGFYITEQKNLNTTYSSQRHGNINKNGLPAIGTSVSVQENYRALADINSGYGYNIFYLIPNQVDIPEPTADDIVDPPITPKDDDTNNEVLACNNEQNALYITSEYTYTENSSIQGSNPYCNVTCETKVTVNYPNVFSTTPAGQNFELVYEPTINAKKTCQAKFDYTQWKTNYDAAIKYEKQALENYNYAVALKDQAEGITITQTTSDGYECDPETDPFTGKTYYTSDSYVLTVPAKEYKTLSDSTSKKTIYGTSEEKCNKSTLEETKTNYENTANETLNGKPGQEGAKNILKDRTQDRLNLEKYNLQCYTSLDSSNTSSTIKNTDIFSESYNTYKDTTGKSYTEDIEVETNIESLNSVSSGTSSTYSSYIPGNNVALSTGIITKKNTLEFFTFEPQLNFVYENGLNTLGSKTKSDEEKMLVEASIVKDTGPYTEGNANKNIQTQNISSYIYYDFGKTEYLSFNAYKVSDIYRTVEYSYKFHEGTEYCGNIKGGEFEKCQDVLDKNDYRTLSTYVKYSNKNNDGYNYYYNHNYPVKLNAKADNYKVNFNLLKTDVLEKIGDFTGKYECSYEVTNDLINLEDKDLDVLFRSVSTNKLDPNNRYAVNKFGENWIDEKGQTVKNIIELNAQESTKNTYNPDNLEYSFTLTPSLINAIQDYNKENKYYEYDLNCNAAGMQCTSSFLTELSEGKVDGRTIEKNYSIKINNFNIDNARDKWKYYLSNDLSGCEKIREDVNNMYNCSYNTILTTDDYNNYYRISGVLP